MVILHRKTYCEMPPMSFILFLTFFKSHFFWYGYKYDLHLPSYYKLDLPVNVIVIMQ